MSMLYRDSVSWISRAKSGTDALGNPSYATGTPTPVTGHFQHRTAELIPGEAAAALQIDAIFYSEWTSGAIDDQIVFDGITYFVKETSIKRTSTGAVDHVRYILSRRTTGRSADGV